MVAYFQMQNSFSALLRQLLHVIAHYECGFNKDDLKVGVTPEGCIVTTTKTYFETPIPDKLTPEEYQRLGSVLASLLDSIDAKQTDTATLVRIKQENCVEKKVKAIEEAKRKG